MGQLCVDIAHPKLGEFKGLEIHISNMQTHLQQHRHCLPKRPIWAIWQHFLSVPSKAHVTVTKLFHVGFLMCHVHGYCFVRMTRLIAESLWLWLKETNVNWNRGLWTPTSPNPFWAGTWPVNTSVKCLFFYDKKMELWFSRCTKDLLNCDPNPWLVSNLVIHLIWSGLIRLLDSFLPIFSLRGKICLFYSWVSFWVWKGKIDSAPVGCQWRSDPEKERGRRGGVAAREVPQLCKPLQFSLECLSLGLNPHGPPPNRFRLKFLHSARPCAPLLPQRSAHTKGHSKRINTKSMGNSEKSKKKEREKSP